MRFDDTGRRLFSDSHVSQPEEDRTNFEERMAALARERLRTDFGWEWMFTELAQQNVLALRRPRPPRLRAAPRQFARQARRPVVAGL